MFLIATIYEANNGIQKIVWWGKGKHHLKQDNFAYPDDKWVESYGIYYERCARKRLTTIPNKIYFDGRVFTAYKSCLYHKDLWKWIELELVK